MTPNMALDALRNQRPLVHCITNYVAMNLAANVTLAAGASPAMIHAIEEVADFAPISGALTINIGTLSAPWVKAMHKATQAANQASVPWVLDPVAHFATQYRSDTARDLLNVGPTILRGNASEIIALAGGGSAGKGADSGDAVATATASAISLAQKKSCVVVVTGEQDFATDGTRRASVTGGSAVMPQVTALGCALTALTGAYAAVTSPLDAAVAALTHFAAAGEAAGKLAQGPGTFSVHFLDALHAVQPGDLDEARVTWG